MALKPHVSHDWSPAHLLPGSDGVTLLAQLGQSLDGQIATATGQSKYINGQAGLGHLHRLRAWADVVIVGVGTVIADDPKLTVRLAPGADPDRVVIDPTGRAPMTAQCLQDNPVRRVVLTAHKVDPVASPLGLEVVRIASTATGDQIDTHQIRSWIAEQGWRNVLLEGGAVTLSNFLSQGTLDYLHLIVSPLLLGPGTAGVRAQHMSQLSQARRFEAQPYELADDLLIECAFG